MAPPIDAMTATPGPWVPDAAVLALLGTGPEMPPREAQLYARYVRALALLCECAPYVDEPDYAELIDTLLEDACAHYPLDVHKDGDQRELAPRGATDV